MPEALSYSKIRPRLLGGSLHCREVVQTFLQQVRDTAELNIYLEVWEEEALARADLLDRKWQADPSSCGPLFGMVISLKDVIAYAGHRLGAASRMLEGYVPSYSATVTERLLAADAILLGRVNCDEFAMGSANEYSAYGPVRNPLFPDRVPGGSSGGSAAAVAAGTCHLSLGSDTGGSVRQPAAFCGVTGLKPTYGRISRYGLIAYGSSLDQIGLLGQNAEDVARVLEVIAGADPRDPTAAEVAVPSFCRKGDQVPLRIARLRVEEKGQLPVDPEILEKETRMAQWMSEKGHAVEEVPFPLLDYLVPAYYVIATAEASSNLARYDGVRYGYRAAEAKSLRDLYRQSRTEGFGMEVKRRILLGTFVLSSGYYDAYYRKALRIRDRIREEALALFERYDLLLLPVSPVLPWERGSLIDDPLTAYWSDVFTVLANLAGLPAISVPAGATPHGLPVGMQWVARPWGEQTLLDLGREWENQMNGH